MPKPAKVQGWQDSAPRPSRSFPRHYLVKTVNLSEWQKCKPYAEDLLNRQLVHKKSFLAWLSDYMEFQNAVMEEGSRLYIDNTCDTRDREKEKSYLHFVENMEPELEKFEHRIRIKIHGHPLTKKISAREYGRWLLSIKQELALFKEENIPLQTEIARRTQEYQKLCGAMTAVWEGRRLTLSRLGLVLEGRNRSRRKRAWQKISGRYHSDKARLNRLFRRLFNLRRTMAANLGLKDYREYCFRKYERTDYTYNDCFKFHDTVEKVVVPMYTEILKRRKERLGLKRLRPWDILCDVSGRSRLKPFNGPGELLRGVGRIFRKLDPELHGYFKIMHRKRLLDLENRIGKAPGGYQCTLQEIRYPFIFMNSVNSNQDVFTLLHEAGHSFHLFLTREKPLAYNREACTEFSEVASMGMERLGMKFLDVFYSSRDAARAIVMEDEEVFRLLVWVSIVDLFQHWMYTHPAHSAAEREQYWSELMERFGCGVDWTGLKKIRKESWHRQLHIFEIPFYYIEYGIAQLGALQIWEHSLKNHAGAVHNYKKGLRYGGTLGLKQLFAEAGLKFDFSPETVEPLLTRVYKEWEAFSRLSSS
jgi:oligoendopeptidase F